MTPGDEQLFDWRRGGAAAIALIATLVLLGMFKMPAIVDFGKCSLDRAIPAVDCQNCRLDPGDDPHRLANLIGALHFIMEDVRMLGAKGTDARQLGKVSR